MMRRMQRLAVPLVFLGLSACAPGAEEGGCWTTSTPEQLAERPSPLDSAMVTLGDAQAKVCYGRPSARERQVMGGLVQYGEPWRFGANEATAIHLPFPAEIGGVAVQPGAYSLYAIPGTEEWTVVVNGNAERWGIPVDGEVTARDLGSFVVVPEALDAPVETLTLDFQATGPDQADLVAEWALTRIRIPVRRVAEG
ncbi:MAG TPA: DUF2911 domain-containing protein [Longimicrobiales bacterium]|nr:DUF2911 domain-containing protein [Longimicrobiales bacterium]